MKKRNLFVRITAIVLCALMVISVFSAAIYAFAADVSVAPSPETGSPDNTWLILIAVVAILAIATCVILPRMKKK